ncbi:S8 family serine peptidase [Pseudomarimonas arenosa]|uniref:S8 family serine peptidase n=1 Tax=Pseudomarimonas arenosa TaxID=2774145 RepID=A0AAW3ZMI2_9GAMM|nr:S8 family serine peptidase [Pseudomarimonas arenosa]MBD8526685.1 S8 family serine peptidase [Pseudomarimonas arenosa]
MAFAGAAQAEADFRITSQPVPGQYIVVLKDTVAAMGNENRAVPPVAQMAQQLARQHRMQVRQSFSHVLRGFVVQADDAALAQLLADDRVDYVQEDGYVSINATQSGATWGIDRSDQRNLPLNGTYVYDTTASNVHAYIIDTGVLGTHNEFSGRMGTGYTSINDGRGTTDCNGHGTHVAGTVAGTTYGIAKGARVYPVRVLNCSGSGTNSGVIAGMDWVAANHVKPAVANMSLGGGADSATDTAVNNMVNAGVTVVVAAGNDNSNACNYSPARAAAAITVGSTTSSDARSSFSNYGNCLDIFAPGSSITSAWYNSNSATNTISGTSMASPHVAGVAALYLANNPTATPSQVTNAIIAASTPNVVSSAGSGSPNRLLYSLFGGTPPTDTTPPSTPSNFSASAASSSAISLSWSAATDTGGSGLAGYKLERCSGSSCTNFAQVATTSSTSYSDSGLSASTTYRYRVRAYDGAGNNGSYSSIASATTQSGGGGGTTLSNGVPVTGLSASTGQALNYTMAVPAGASNLRFVTSGGSGDADLYVKFGSAPTTSSYDCRSWSSSNNETCNISSAQAGTYYVMVRAYSSFSGVSLTGSYTAGGGGTQTYANESNYTINDNSTINSPISVSGRSGNGLSSTQVAVDIKHTYIGDLTVDLIAPDGSVYNLHNRSGGSADNIIRNYTVNLSSEALNGSWTLRVRDSANADTGYLDRWAITF